MTNTFTHFGTRTIAMAAGLCLLAGGAWAQSGLNASPEAYEQHYGLGYGAEERGYVPNSRDANGNRVVINGIIMQGNVSHISGVGVVGSGAGYGSTPLAIGNNLNVITQGSWNTVIVDSTQTNTGDVTATAQ